MSLNPENMKLSYNNILYILSVMTISFGMVSCADDIFERDGETTGSDGMIRFDVSSGFEHSRSSRAGGSDADLPPVMFAEGSDTLYIHRYVATEMERATGHDITSDATRAAQVNTVADFKTLCENFYVKATFATDDKSTYIPLSKTSPVSTDPNGDIWHIPSARYSWPTERKLIFNACAPVSAASLLNGLDLGMETLGFSYTVPVSTTAPRTDAEVQPDIMLASTTCSRNEGAVNGQYAPLNFRHALSAIKFAVRDVADGEIVDITIKGVSGSGSCSFNPSADSAPAFIWSNLGETTAEYTQVFNYATTAVTDPADLPDLEGVTVINDADGMNDKTFMLIPQTIPDDAELIITFKPKDGAEKKLKGKLKSSDIPAWEAGKEYIYTISTSSELWTYIFEVTGCEQAENKYNPANGVFTDHNTDITINATVVDGAYYKVTSYRVRKNNPNIKEAVPWTAVSSEGQNHGAERYQTFIDKYQKDISMTYTPKEWFPEIGIQDSGDKLALKDNDTFSDTGSIETDENGVVKPKQYKLKFKTQYVATNWEGDWQMRAKDEIGQSDKPIDLSLKNCGNSAAQTTANCYVINRGGWYKFPLVYGNAITDGNPNPDSYSFSGGTVSTKYNDKVQQSFSPLKKFTGYDDKAISSPYITNAESTLLVWQDAYGIMDYIDLSTDKKELIFHVARPDLQQSNSVIAIRDKDNNIIWSWHIWVNEAMVDDDQNLVGGISCDTWSADDQKAGFGPFELAQRNLGWCDPKEVEYLERTGTFTFTQDGGKKLSKTLNVKQKGKLIEFYIGNNTYYQWGRKDPMVGFRYSDEDFDGTADYLKYNFGELPYGYLTYVSASIATSIKNPSYLLSGNDAAGTDQYDWMTNGHYYNMWNNYPDYENYLQIADGSTVMDPGTNTPVPSLEYAYSGVKTIYDPSPAGYMVPPQKIFELFTKGQNQNRYVSQVTTYGKKNLSDVFNGLRKQKNSYFEYDAYPNRAGSGTPSILLSGTGQRWHRDKHSVFKLGGNMNQNHVYLWTSSITFYDKGTEALSFIVGNEQDLFISTTRLQARRSIARPIRSVKESSLK